jgi:dienelactone hydrolase
MLPDSFTPRGHAGGVCTVPLVRRRADVGPRQRARDAHEALKHLRTLPYVDARRVAIVGGSHGGTSALVAMEQAGFSAAVALYPRCVPQRTYAPAGPVLILIGERDDWTPADACRRLTEASRTAGYRVTIKVYPGAHHSFDSPYPVRYVAERVNSSAPGGRGATTGGDPVAWADSIREVFTFLELQLK